MEGNVKLILGLIWRLIQKYQISTGSKQTKVPSKKSMLNWIDAVLPDRHISNFTTDWNDGTALRLVRGRSGIKEKTQDEVSKMQKPELIKTKWNVGSDVRKIMLLITVYLKVAMWKFAFDHKDTY